MNVSEIVIFAIKGACERVAQANAVAIVVYSGRQDAWVDKEESKAGPLFTNTKKQIAYTRLFVSSFFPDASPTSLFSSHPDTTLIFFLCMHSHSIH